MFYYFSDVLRIVFALLSGGLISFIFYPIFIKKLSDYSFGQSVRDDGPKAHLKKQGTPTMGGLLLIIATIFSCLLWADLSQVAIWLLIYTLAGFGLIGIIDDLRKITKNNSKGLSARGKLLAQIFISLSALLIYQHNFSSMPYLSTLSVPFVAVDTFSLIVPSWLYIAGAVFIIVATSNSVNLSDGLDGLAAGLVIKSTLVFLILAYLASAYIGDFAIADYLNIFHVKAGAEIAVFCAALIGASVGFLWYNTYPAAIFMGDVGSLALGGVLGMLAILSKNELLSALLNGVFLLETLSVIIQVASFKLRKKRVFKMAPLHHHFELIGWAEPKIIVRFWIIGSLLALLTLLSLLVR